MADKNLTSKRKNCSRVTSDYSLGSVNFDDDGLIPSGTTCAIGAIPPGSVITKGFVVGTLLTADTAVTIKVGETELTAVTIPASTSDVPTSVMDLVVPTTYFDKTVDIEYSADVDITRGNIEVFVEFVELNYTNGLTVEPTSRV